LKTADLLAAIAGQLEALNATLRRQAGLAEPTPIALTEAAAYHWDAQSETLRPVATVNRIPLDLLRGIDDVRRQLHANTLQFARGHAANNALLWGAKGMGKSSLVKALHGQIAEGENLGGNRLVLVEISRDDIATLPRLMRAIAPLEARFLIFCDDLSFDEDGADYKALKSILDGGLEGRPDNVLFYATSNRRHLMPRDMIENEQSTAISPSEAIDEKVSLSDRFGLWLGFHNCSQDEYLEMIEGYVAHYGIDVSRDDLRARAIEWAQTRGARSGRVAIQFVRQIAGEKGRSL